MASGLKIGPGTPPILTISGLSCVRPERHIDTSTMNATGPTTRPALPFYKLRTRPLDPVPPRLCFLCGFNPANPLITR